MMIGLEVEIRTVSQSVRYLVNGVQGGGNKRLVDGTKEKEGGVSGQWQEFQGSWWF